LPNFVSVIWNDQPIGFVRAVNLSLHKSVGEYIVLLNDDIELLDNNWFDNLVKPFTEMENCGITGPRKWWYNVNGLEYPQMAFWCACFKKITLNKVGFLDDIFHPGCGEDIDFCIKIYKMGLKIVGVPDDYKNESEIENKNYTKFPINHLGGSTFARNNEAHLNTIKLREKSAKILDDRYKNAFI
jgi:GT2 family glycosyltransferase